ncbi:MAG: CHAD domain-containing protein [bacterium]|nr:CHAD domain-containing protein [bacterium]
MEAAQLFLEAFDRRREHFLVRLKVCREDFSEAAVHDLRVAARRLIAFVEVAGLLDGRGRPSRARRQLKDLIDGFDDLRDTQVMQASLDDHAREEPTLVALREHLLAQEQDLLRDARRAARAFGRRELKDRLQRLRARLDEQLCTPAPDLDPFAPVDEAFARVVHCDAEARPEDTASIHRVRLAFKKFRYRFEIVQPALPALPADHAARLHTYQTIVGRVQDAETFLTLARECAAGNPAFAPEPALAFYARLRAEAIDDWLAQRSAVAGFWRPGPDRPFPWLTRRPRRREGRP